MKPSIITASLLSLHLFACHAELIEERCIAEPQASLHTPASAPVSPSSTPAARPEQSEAELRMIIFQDKKPMLALQRVFEKEWLQGEATWLSKGQPLALRGELNDELLDASNKAWRGQRVRLYKEDSSFCEARVTRLSLLAQLIDYSEEIDDDAQSTWSRAQESGGVRVVAELDLEACEGALFARLSSLPVPQLVNPTLAAPNLEKLALTKMRELSTYKKIQREFQQYKDTNTYVKVTHWENFEDAKPAVLTFSMYGKTFAFVSADAGHGCGQFSESLSALWEVTGSEAKPALSLMLQSQSGLFPNFVLDVNNDQNFEYIEQEGIYHWSNGELEQDEDVTVPSSGDGTCGC